MAAKRVSRNAELGELFGLRIVLRAEGPSPPGSAPLTEGSPRLTWAGHLQEGHRLQQLPMARHVGSGRCRAFSSPLLLLGFLNDCPRRSCVAFHTVVYRPQSWLPPSASVPTLRSRQGQMLAIGLRTNLRTQCSWRGGPRDELQPTATASSPAGLGGFPQLFCKSCKTRRTHPCSNLKAGFSSRRSG